MFEGFGDVLQGDKPLQIEARVSEKDMQKLALYLFVGVFVGMLLANIITLFKR